jgi:NAD(P)-dependent dehydrogenase (short-subunit alcohol dehydrogenase family)
MRMTPEVVVIGGTAGLGRAIALAYVGRGARVGVGGRDAARAGAVAAELGGNAYGFAIDVAHPEGIGDALRELGAVDRLVVTAILRDQNAVRSYELEGAVRLSTMKLVGYTEIVHQLADRLSTDASILLFGGLAKDRPYPGSTTVTSVNGAVATLIRSLAIELAPVRVNAIHPGIVADTAAWSGREDALARVLERTPTGRHVQTSDVVDASLFLLENPSMNGANLEVDGGWMML